HQNAISTTSFFSYLDRSSESSFLRAAFQTSQAVTIGPETSVGFTAYDQHLLSDSLNYSVGAFADLRASERYLFMPRAGWTYYSFYPEPHRQKPPDSSSYYFGVQMTHGINEFLSAAIDAGRQLRLGVNSELIDLWYVRPRLECKLFEKISLEAHF